jgi:hypothetical protein
MSDDPNAYEPPPGSWEYERRKQNEALDQLWKIIAELRIKPLVTKLEKLLDRIFEK